MTPAEPPSSGEASTTPAAAPTSDSDSASESAPASARPILPRPLVHAVGLVVLMLVLIWLVVPVFLPPSAGAQSAGIQPVGIAVHDVDLDLGSASSDPNAAAGPLQAVAPGAPVDYRSVGVDLAGSPHRFGVLAGPVEASVGGATHLMAAEIDGLRIGSGAPGFHDAVVEAMGSTSMRRWVRIGDGSVAAPAWVDLRFPRPLQPGDLVLVQEAGGDDPIELLALDGDGVIQAGPVTVGPSHHHDTGHRNAAGDSHWVTVAPVPGGGDGVQVLRVRSAKAEVKVLVLDGQTATGEGSPVEAAPASGVLPIGLATPPSEHTTTTEAAPPADLTTAEPDPAPAPEPAPAPAEPAPEPVEQTDDQPAQAPVQPPTELAMTGVTNEPWLLALIATGLIFFGYTVVAAFRHPVGGAGEHVGERGPGQARGHALLDALGFD